MDLQETFDVVAGHLINQNKRAVYIEEGKMPVLMYQTPDGLTCAIGCLFAGGTYHPDIEGYAFKGMDTWKQHADNDGLTKMRQALKLKGVYVDDESVLRMLTDLQGVHDNHEPEFWPARLKAVARTWRVHDYVIDHAVHRRDYGTADSPRVRLRRANTL